MRTKLQLVALVIAALCFFSVGMSGCVSNTTPATPTYQFTTGTAPPQAVSDLIRYGTAVLLINQRNCTACEEANPKFADLQTRYNDTNVRFATFYINDNTTSPRVARAYAVNVTPTVLVVREDGAFAKFVPPLPYPSDAGIDFNAVKSAIDEAQKWQSLNPTATAATPTPAADLSSYYNKYWESGNGIVERPFTKSTNARGNDVYKGVVRSTAQSQSMDFTLVVELTNTKDQAVQLYDKAIADRLNEGFTARPDWVAKWNATYKWPTAQIWMGQRGSQQYYVMYRYAPYPVDSWELTTEALY
jgi:thiol-disulfide isomerase/thioredoxin